MPTGNIYFMLLILHIIWIILSHNMSKALVFTSLGVCPDKILMDPLNSNRADGLEVFDRKTNSGRTISRFCQVLHGVCHQRLVWTRFPAVLQQTDSAESCLTLVNKQLHLVNYCKLQEKQHHCALQDKWFLKMGQWKINWFVWTCGWTNSLQIWLSKIQKFVMLS